MSESFLQDACELLNTLERGLVELGARHGQSETSQLLSSLHALKAKAVAVGLCEFAYRQMGVNAARDAVVYHPPVDWSLTPVTTTTRLFQIVIRFEPEADYAAALMFLEQAALHGDLIEVETLYDDTSPSSETQPRSLGFRMKLRTQADLLTLRAMCMNAIQAQEVQLAQVTPGAPSLLPVPPNFTPLNQLGRRLHEHIARLRDQDEPGTPQS